MTVPIANTGLPTVGLDLSAPMLTTARQRAATANVSVEYVLGDMRNFDLGRKFALIFIARNSLLHLYSTEDLLAAFAVVRRHMAPGGIFAFDVFNPNVRLLGHQTSAFQSFKSKLNRSVSFRSRKQPIMILPREWAVAVGTFRLREIRMPGCYVWNCETFFRRSCRCYSRRGAFTSKVAWETYPKHRSIPPAAFKYGSVRQQPEHQAI